MRLGCNVCGKPVSTEIPEETIVRAWLECPECGSNISDALKLEVEELKKRIEELKKPREYPENVFGNQVHPATCGGNRGDEAHVAYQKEYFTALRKAEEFLERFIQLPVIQMAEQIAETAVDIGFFGIWTKVFAAHPLVLNEIISRFPMELQVATQSVGDLGELVLTPHGLMCPVPGCGYKQNWKDDDATDSDTDALNVWIRNIPHTKVVPLINELIVMLIDQEMIGVREDGVPYHVNSGDLLI